MIPKFRAWDKEKKWMVYDVQDAYDGLWSERNSDEINDYYGYVSNFQSFTDEEEFNFMQYTGLKDKNGAEIYEGDIVRRNIYVPGDNVVQVVGVIKYSEQEVRFVFRYNGVNYDPYHSYNEWVVGNIYEHPHLLEEKDK